MPSAIIKYINNMNNNVTEISSEMKIGKLNGLNYIKKSDVNATTRMFLLFLLFFFYF